MQRLATSILAGAAILAAAAGANDPAVPYEVTETVVVEATYERASGVEAHVAGNAAYAGISDCGTEGGCVRFEVRPDFRMFDLEVVDATGAVVHAASGTQGIPSVCGSTPETSHLYDGLDEIVFFVFAGTCDDGSTASLPTSGTVRVTFHASDDPWCMGC